MSNKSSKSIASPALKVVINLNRELVIPCPRGEYLEALQRVTSLWGTAAVDSKEGFVTNDHEFVDPMAARKVAIDAGQCTAVYLLSAPSKLMPLTVDEALSFYGLGAIGGNDG